MSSEHGGPERRRAPRRRVAKPYAKAAKAVEAPKSSFSSLIGFFAAPIKRVLSYGSAGNAAEDSSDDGSDAETASGGEETDRQLKPATQELAGTSFSTGSTFTAPDVARSTTSSFAWQSASQDSQPSQKGDSRFKPSGGDPGSSRIFASRVAATTGQRTSTLSPPSSFASGRSTALPFPLHPNEPTPSTSRDERQPSPYKEIVDFLNTKKDGKLNEMELAGITQALRQNATQDDQSSTVPSAALLDAFKQSTSVAASPRKPLLFPSTPIASPFVAQTSSTPSPARARRRRNLYTGVGQSPRSSSIPARTSQPSSSRLRLQQPDEPAPSSNKKRLVGDSAIPMSSGTPGASSSASSAETSSVPFPAQSPAKPQRAAPPSTIAPSTRAGAVNGAGAKGAPFGKPARPSIVPPARPGSARQPSPLRKSNLDMSVSSTNSDVDDSFEAAKPELTKTRSQASAAILDIVMDEANSLPPVKPRVSAELKNPFEDMRPAHRVSTPVRRVSKTLSRPWAQSPAASPAPKRGIDSDNILDQIESTAPKQPSPSKKSKTDETGDLPGVVNPFASASGSTSTSATRQQRLKSPPPTNIFKSTTPTTSPTKSAFAFGGGAGASNAFSSFGSASDPKMPTASAFGSKNPEEAPKTSPFGTPSGFFGAPAPVVVSNASVPAPTLLTTTTAPSFFPSPLPKITASPQPQPRAPATTSSFFGNANAKQSTSASAPVVVVLDDSDEENDVAAPAAAKKCKPAQDDVVIEVIDEEEEDELESDAGSSSGATKVQQPSSVEEVEDHSLASGSKTRNGTSNGSRLTNSLSIPNGLHSQFKTASPVVPSPLRHVSIPPEDESSSSPDDEEIAVVPASKFKVAAVTNGKSSSGAPQSLDPKERAKQVPLKSLTTFDLVARDKLLAIRAKRDGKKELEAEKKARQAAAGRSAAELPHFDLTVKPVAISSSSAPAETKSTGFNWAAAGVKAPTAKAGEWTCSLCALKNAATATKCIACETAAPASAFSAPSSSSSSTPAPPAAPSGGFDWAKAGMAPPSKPSTDEWKCDLCGCTTPATKDKCVSCETPRPGAKSAPAASAPAAGGGFNWAAAGMKPPPATSAGTWTCKMCQLTSPVTADKCTICEAPRS